MFDEETIAELTTTLSGNVELYNKVINIVQEKEEKITVAEEKSNSLALKLEESEKRGQQYLGQISNLLSKIPITSTTRATSVEEKIEEVKNREWVK